MEKELSFSCPMCGDKQTLHNLENLHEAMKEYDSLEYEADCEECGNTFTISYVGDYVETKEGELGNN